MSVGLCTRVKSWGEEGNSLKKASLCWLMREKKGYVDRLEEVIWWKDQKERGSGEGEGTVSRWQVLGSANIQHRASRSWLGCHAREGAREEVTLI